MCDRVPIYPNLIYSCPFIPVVYPPATMYPIQLQPYTPSIQPAGGFENHQERIEENQDALDFRQQYPDVDPAIFHQSADSFKSLISDGNKLLDQLSESESFAEQIMDAAQQGDKEEVKKLVESTDLQASVKTRFNPDSITITLYSNDEQENCCKLAMGFRWK